MLLNQDLQDFEDFLALDIVLAGAHRSAKCKTKIPLIVFAAAIIASAKST